MVKALGRSIIRLLRRITGQNQVIDGLNNIAQQLDRSSNDLAQTVNSSWIHRYLLHDCGVITDFRLFHLPPVAVAPLVDIPYPTVDLDAGNDPPLAIINAPEFEQCIRFFTQSPAINRSLVSAGSQALLFSLIRNQKPQHVFEIGTYRAGTSEAICRALLANRTGTLHTVDPYGMSRVPPLVAQWPEELQKHVRFYPSSSMTFYMQMETEGTRPELVLVDGNHQYEYAGFDIMAAARQMKPGGFIFIDNVSQPGPFFAVADFLASHPEWRECGHPGATYRTGRAYDPDRIHIAGTDFAVLRAPSTLVVGSRPVCLGQQRWHGETARVVEATLAEVAPSGELFVQAVLRGFGDRSAEVATEGVINLCGEQGRIRIPLASPLAVDGHFNRMTIEVWLTWIGDQPLRLQVPPVVLE